MLGYTYRARFYGCAPYRSYRMKLGLMIGTLCIASIGMVGCASKVQQPDEYSGFLKDYSRLKEAKSPSGAEVMRWIDPKLKPGQYTSVYIEPTQLYPAPKPTEKIPQSTLNGITQYYDQALKRELSQQTMMANKVPGLYFIGESVDVTGWLGGYNFQWAWASGVAAGIALQ